ncbi:MAG: hypothetical protein R2860_16540 [Desulfobacterales bacterium]
MFVDVDVNVPRTAMKNPDAVAVVIGNKTTGIKMYRRLNTPSGMLTPSANIWSKHWAIVKKHHDLYDAPVSVFNELFGTSSNYKGKLFNFIKPENPMFLSIIRVTAHRI